MSKPRFKFGYTMTTRLSPTTHYRMRADYAFRVGIWGSTQEWNGVEQRWIDVYSLTNAAEVTFVSFAETAEQAVAACTNVYALHPLVLPVMFNPNWEAGFDQDLMNQASSLVFSETNSGSLMMGQLHRWYETPAVLKLIGSCIDYPDDNMSFAASDRFNTVRDVWSKFDYMTKFWYCLHMRGARLVRKQASGEWVMLGENYQVPDWRLIQYYQDTRRMCDELKERVDQEAVLA